jgi:hypothetical protein
VFIRTLRAFAWMRWRVLMNTLDRTGARDALERLSLAVENLGPLIATAMLVPSAIALAALGSYAGYWIVKTDWVLTLHSIRILLLLATGFSAVGPLLLPSIERTSAVRLLLLPIPRSTLYLAQASGAVSDPWILLVLPLVLGIAAGLAAAGALTAAVLALVAGLLLLVILIGVTALATFVLQLLVRDRRRGEILALLLVMLPMLGLLPALLDSRSSDERIAERNARVGRRARGENSIPDRMWRVGTRAYTLLPSESFVAVVRRAAHRNPGGAIAPLAGLAGIGLTAHALGLLAFGRLLDAPSSGSRRKVRVSTRPSLARIPGLSRESTAVALAQIRLGLRTPRGRSIMLSPLLVFTMLALVMSRRGGSVDLGFTALGNGLALATFGSSIALVSILPFAMNQFAVDRAGLTLALLSPLDTMQLLVGKAVGNAFIAAVPALAILAVAYLVFQDGTPALWLTLPLALTATYALAAPGAAALSAIFPRTVDLNSISRGSNAHGAAGLLGLFVFVAAALPAVMVVMISLVILDRPWLAPLLMLGWCAAAIVTGTLLLRPVVRLFEHRRENLALVA